MPRGKVPPIHPGEILLEEFLVPLGISQYRLAKETSVPPRRSSLSASATVELTIDSAVGRSLRRPTASPHTTASV